MLFRTYYHMIRFGQLTESTAMTFLEYIQVRFYKFSLINDD